MKDDCETLSACLRETSTVSVLQPGMYTQLSNPEQECWHGQGRVLRCMQDRSQVCQLGARCCGRSAPVGQVPADGAVRNAFCLSKLCNAGICD